MKVSSSSKKEPSTKVKKLEEELSVAKSKISLLREQNRLERKKTIVARQSRDNWKNKNKKKVNEIKGLRKKMSRQDKPKGHYYEVNVIGLCILLRIVGGCSYRSIPRILNVLKMVFELPWQKIPCANSIENWVSKMGLYQMENAVERVKQKKEQFCLIVDENLRLGNERMLLLMISPYEKQEDKALSYEDVEIVYMGGKKSWTGEKIEKEVQKIIENKEMQIGNIVSDEDSKLLKSARLLGLPHLPDISHLIGNCLRKVFKKEERYASMIKLIGQLQSKSVNQKLTYLRPPKQRIKARFMNQEPLVEWGLTMLARFEELEEEEQLFFQELKKHQEMFNTLNRCMEVSRKISIPLKCEGLNQKTLKNFKTIIAQSEQQLEQRGKAEKEGESQKRLIKELVQQYLGHLKTYADKYEKFLGAKTQSYHVSSDIMESIFGKHKNLISTNPLTGMTILDLELPVHCQDKSKIPHLVKVALEDISMTSLFKWRAIHSSGNQVIKRKLFFKKRA